jgi:hypothetical protein
MEKLKQQVCKETKINTGMFVTFPSVTNEILL